jgi:GTP:adenosylcobinamide-phosphate guanylyltransferase
MKCVVLAAGYATRLYPLTENFPKPLLPVGGKPILNWLLDDIDFTSGSCFAISGNLQKISHYIFIITPASVDISGDFQDIFGGAGSFEMPINNGMS